MSLASSAAPWTTDDSSLTRKRHIPVRRTVRARVDGVPAPTNAESTVVGGGGAAGAQREVALDALPLNGSYLLRVPPPTRNNDENQQSMTAQQPTTAASLANVDDILSRINAAENRATFVGGDNDGSGLADFRPPPPPQITRFPPQEPMAAAPGLGATAGNNNNIPLDSAGAQYRPAPAASLSGSSRAGAAGALANATDLGMYTEYREAHDPANTLYYAGGVGSYSGGAAAAARPMINNQMVYNNNGSGGGAGGGFGSAMVDKLAEKVNYLVYMMEEQQMAKTNYAFEEMMLYAYLGVFMIFICDCFVRMGGAGVVVTGKRK